MFSHFSQISHVPDSDEPAGTCDHCGGALLTEADTSRPFTPEGSTEVFYLDALVFRPFPIARHNRVTWYRGGVSVRCSSCHCPGTQPLADWGIKLTEFPDGKIPPDTTA